MVKEEIKDLKKGWAYCVYHLEDNVVHEECVCPLLAKSESSCLRAHTGGSVALKGAFPVMSLLSPHHAASLLLLALHLPTRTLLSPVWSRSRCSCPPQGHSPLRSPGRVPACIMQGAQQTPDQPFSIPGSSRFPLWGCAEGLVFPLCFSCCLPGTCDVRSRPRFPPVSLGGRKCV